MVVDQPTSLDCPSCGAPLQPAANASRVVCQYCHATIALPKDETDQAIIIESGDINLPKPDPRKILYLFVGLITLSVFVGGVIIFVVSNALIVPTQDARTKIYSLTNPQLLPSISQNDAGKIVAVSYNSDESYRLAMFDFSHEEPLSWQSPDLGVAGYQVNFKVNDDAIFAIADTGLTAFRLTDGQKLWETSISDRLPVNCPSCLLISQNHVFVLTQVGSLHAFDISSGQQMWVAKLAIFNDSIRLMNGNPLIAHEQDDLVRLTEFDAENGEVIEEVFPTCPNQVFPDDEQEFGINDFLVTDNEHQDFYLVYGFWEPGCLEKWHGFDMQRQWQALLPEDLVRSEPSLLVSNDTLFLSKPSGDQIWMVDEINGDARQLILNSDYSLQPIFFQNDILIIEAIRTRGSVRYELWAINTKTGKQSWQIIPKAKKSLEDNVSSIVGADGIFSVQPDGEALILLQAFDDNPTISFERIDIKSGVIDSHTELILPEATIFTLDLIGWHGQTVWLIADDILAIDSSNASILHKFE